MGRGLREKKSEGGETYCLWKRYWGAEEGKGMKTAVERRMEEEKI